MKIFIKKILKRKSLTVFIIIVLAVVIYFSYGAFFGRKSTTQYVSAKVQKGTIVVSVTGSGQVSASNQIDIKPKVSGEITGVYVTAGQEVKAGTLLAQIDTSDAERSVRDAETSLETAKLELDKLLEPADALTLLQAENALTQAQESKQNAEDDLKKAYEDGFNTVANAFLNLPALMSGLQEMLFSSDRSLGGATGNQANIDYYADAVKNYDSKALLYYDDANTKYQTSRTEYELA